MGTSTRLPYAGGREFKFFAPGKGVVRSPNLTPDAKTGLGNWTREQFVARFRGESLEKAKATPVDAAGGFQTPMPWWAYSGLTEEDLLAMFDFLKALPPVENAVVRHTP